MISGTSTKGSVNSDLATKVMDSKRDGTKLKGRRASTPNLEGVKSMLDTLETRLQELDPELYAHTSNLDKATEQITRQYHKPKFMAKNGHDHAKRMLKFLATVQDRLKTRLSASELYVLCAATYLHDIGMYCYFYLDTHDKALFSENVFRNLDGEECFQLYSNHDKFSKRYINENHDGAIDIFPLGLTDMPHTTYIADLSGRHKDPDPISEDQKPSGLRMRLLKALLQFADAGDMTKERAYDENKNIEMKDVSFDTYWKFQYIDGPDYFELNGKFVYHLKYKIPRDFRDHFESYMRVAESRFRRYDGDAVDVINEFCVSIIDVDNTVNKSKFVFDDSVDKMPADILSILKDKAKGHDPYLKIKELLEQAKKQERKPQQRELAALNYREAARTSFEETQSESALKYIEKALRLLDADKHLVNMLETLELAARISNNQDLHKKTSRFLSEAIGLAERSLQAGLIDKSKLMGLRERNAAFLADSRAFEKAVKAYLELGEMASGDENAESRKRFYSMAASLFSRDRDIEPDLSVLENGARIARGNRDGAYLEALMALLVARIESQESDWLKKTYWLEKELLTELLTLCEETTSGNEHGLRMKLVICRKLINQMKDSGNEYLLPRISIEKTKLRAKLYYADGEIWKSRFLRLLGHLTNYGESVRNILTYGVIFVILMGLLYSGAGLVTVNDQPASLIQGIAFSFATFCSLNYAAYQPIDAWYVPIICAFEFFVSVCVFGLMIGVIVRKTSLRFH